MLVPNTVYLNCY